MKTAELKKLERSEKMKMMETDQEDERIRESEKDAGDD